MKTMFPAKFLRLGLALLLVISIIGTAVVPSGQVIAAADSSVPALDTPALDTHKVTDAADSAADPQLALAAAAAASGQISVTEAAYQAAEYILGSGVTSEWQAIGLAQAGYKVPDSYIQSLVQKVQAAGGSFTGVTDYARIVLAVRAVGADPADFAGNGSSAGYNLIERIYNNDKISGQTLNYPVYALLALDSASYSIPGDAKWTKAALLAEILSRQNADGGFALNSGASEPDMTAMALTALAAHKSDPAVAAAGQKAVAWLAAAQDGKGGYGDSSESAAQVIIGLASYGIDPAGPLFTKNGADLLGRLLSFHTASGGFAHNEGGSVNALATEQGLQALVAYNLFSGGGNGKLYDFTEPAAQHPLVYVPLVIEGPQGTLGQGNAYAGNVLEALEKVAARNGLALTNPSGEYVTGIGEVSAGTYGGWDGWMYAVVRGGEWLYPDVGMKDFSLKDSDRVVVYYAGSDTQLVESVTVSKAQLGEEEPFTVTVSQIQWVWDNAAYTSNPVISSAAGVAVTIGDWQAVTDKDGKAEFTEGVAAGDYTLTVTGYAAGNAPAVVKYTQAITIISRNVSAYLAVEGPEGMVAEGNLNAANALAALEKLTASQNIPLEITDSAYGSYVSGIAGIANGTRDAYWNFVVSRGGEWIYPSVGMGDFELQPADRVLVYFGGTDTQVVDQIGISPLQPKPDEPFTVKVTQKQWVWNNETYASDPVTSPAAGVQVSAGEATATTNAAGVASFNQGLPAGSYTLAVTGYAEGQAPNIARYTQPFMVSAPASARDSATISVIGDSLKGTILPNTTVTLNEGETAYSLLVRQLGSKVVSSGAGSSLYIKSIDGLKEGDRGVNSGWMYSVNGTYPNYSAASYKLGNGDVVAWRYTVDNGADLGGSTGSTGSTGTGTTAASSVGITADNTLPLGRVGQTTAVSGTAMTAAEAAALKQSLTANVVSIDQAVTPGAAASLKDSGGEIELRLPDGAVSTSVNISVRESSSDRAELVSGLYDFKPDGTKFLVTADLMIRIPVAIATPANLALAWLDESTGNWIPVPASLDLKTGIITGKISHFTAYAVVDRSKFEPQPDQLSSDIAATAKLVAAAGELSDWQAVGLARSGHALPAGYLDGVKEQLAASQGEFRKVTDYERLALSVAAAGGDPQSIGGYNLMERIYNNDKMASQGSNGLIFGLIALDSGSYSVPADALWTKERLIQSILELQSKDGGFPLTAGGTDDVDLTAMAVTALASHQEQTTVQAALDKAVTWLSQQQLENGGYQLSGEDNSESTAQVIIALSTAGIGPGDVRFIKAEGGLLSHLASFRQADGGYAHTSGQPENSLATEQALLALAAYSRFLTGDSPVFSSSLPAVSGAVFTDESRISAWALDAVHTAYNQGLMKGISETSRVFAPKQQMTRAEFAALLLRLLNQAPSTAAAAPVFSDVKADAWYYGAVLKAQELGIIGGVTDTVFNPDGAVTRQDMAVMISRAYNLENGAAAPGQAGVFADERRISGYALSAVHTVAELGYMTGFNGAFDPSAAVTREMAAVVAVRLP